VPISQRQKCSLTGVLQSVVQHVPLYVLLISLKTELIILTAYCTSDGMCTCNKVVPDKCKTTRKQARRQQRILYNTLARTGRKTGWHVCGDHRDEHMGNKWAQVASEIDDKIERQGKVKSFWYRAARCGCVRTRALKTTSNEHKIQFKFKRITDYLERSILCRVLVFVKD
jgi:hypothetical protein